QVTKKINAKIVSFLLTPSSLTACIITPAPNARPITRPVTSVKDVFFCIPKNLVNGLNTLETISIHPSSRKNCIISISGKITAANCNTAMNADFKQCITIAGEEDSSACPEEIKPYCAGSAPPLQKTWMIHAATSASTIRIPEISHQLTPVLDATDDSINKLCEKDSIIAIIKTSLIVKSNETIAPIPAYRLSAFPKTRGIAASPGRPINPISGDTNSINQSKTGVY